MKITNPEIKVALFASDDVIATSLALGPLSGTVGTFYIPTGQYGGSYTGTAGNYIEFSGTLGSYSGGAYNITGIYGAKGGVDEDVDTIQNVVDGKIYFPELAGYGIPADELAPIAQHLYDAYSYGDGNYYTNGVSYYESHWQ